MTCLCTGILFADISSGPLSHVPLEGEFVTTEKIDLRLGGHAAQVSVGLARLGVPVTTSGCVGDDSLSEFILSALAKQGIDTANIQRSPGRCPGTTMRFDVRDQDRRLICTTGANDDFVLTDGLFERLRLAPRNKRKVFYLGGFFMLRGLENERTVEFFKTAREYGWTTMVDVALNGQRPYWDLIEPLLPHIDIFMPNEHEGEKISHDRDPYDQAMAFRDAGAQAVVITQGANGILYCGEKEQFRTGVFATSCVNGSGAGNAFSAGMIAAILEGLEPREMIRWGAAMGASAVRGESSTETLFNRHELPAFLEERHLVVETI